MGSGLNGVLAARHVLPRKPSPHSLAYVLAWSRINVFHRSFWNRKSVQAVLLVPPGRFGLTGLSAQKHAESDSEARLGSAYMVTIVKEILPNRNRVRTETVQHGLIGLSGVLAQKLAAKDPDSGTEFVNSDTKKTAMETLLGLNLATSENVQCGQTGKNGRNVQNPVATDRSFVSEFV